MPCLSTSRLESCSFGLRLRPPGLPHLSRLLEHRRPGPRNGAPGPRLAFAALTCFSSYIWRRFDCVPPKRQCKMEYRRFGRTDLELSTIALGGLLAHYEGFVGHPPPRGEAFPERPAGLRRQRPRPGCRRRPGDLQLRLPLPGGGAEEIPGGRNGCAGHEVASVTSHELV